MQENVTSLGTRWGCTNTSIKKWKANVAGKYNNSIVSTSYILSGDNPDSLCCKILTRRHTATRRCNKYTYIYIYIYIYIGIVKNVSFFRCSAAAKYFAAKILYPQLNFAATLLNFAAILLLTECDPNSCGLMADGPFPDPKGRSYPHPKYWTHRWRIDIDIGHGISPIEPS